MLELKPNHVSKRGPVIGNVFCGLYLEKCLIDCDSLLKHTNHSSYERLYLYDEKHLAFCAEFF